MRKIAIILASLVLSLSVFCADINSVSELIKNKDFSKALTEIKTLNNVNGKNSYGASLLHFGIAFKSDDIVKELISSGADVNVSDNDGNTPLLMAAITKNINVIELLREKDADNKTVNNNGGTAVDIINQITEDMGIFEKAAERRKYIEAIQMLPVHIYAKKGKLSELKAIVEKSKDYNYTVKGSEDEYIAGAGKNLFWYAAENNQIEIMKYLVSNKVNAKITTDVDGSLFEFLLRNLDKCRTSSDFLIKNKVEGADVNGKATNGMTYLMVAAMNKDINRVKYLVENGADVNMSEGTTSMTALKYATKYSSEKENKEVVDYLKSKNAK